VQVLQVSLADAVAVRRIQRPNDANIVVLDIERLPGTFSGKFWDLNDYKGRRIRPDDVTEWPRTICVAWRRYGAKPVEFAAEWDGGRDTMLRRVWDVLDSADIVVGHNVARFDMRKLKADWAMVGMKSPRPWKVVDTLAIARREFGFESNTLGSLCERMGVPGKIGHYDPDCARLACEGDTAAQKRLKVYNQADVEASEALYDAMRGWIPTHPFIGTHGDEKRCNQCSSDRLTKMPSNYRAVVLDYGMWRCDDCGGHIRGGWVARAANTRGVR
jgi:hypothetical protein